MALVLAAHAPALSGQFVNWDDPANLTENEAFRGWSLQSLRWMWTTSHLGVYEPLAWMLKSAVYSTCGLRPAAFHAVSWSLHGLNTLLMFLVARQIFRAAGGPSGVSADAAAAWAALLFGIHPLRVECVAWASGQPYVLSAFFGFAAVWAYLISCRAPAWRAAPYLASLALYACAVLTKSAAIPLVAVLIILDVVSLRRLGPSGGWLTTQARRVWIEKLPFLAVAMFATGMAVRASSESSGVGMGASFSARAAVATFGFAFYLWKTIWPVGLSAFYPPPMRVEWTTGFVLAAAAAAGILGIVAAGRRRWPGLSAAMVAYAVLLAPSAGLIRHGHQLTADRYTYLSCAGLAIAAGVLVVRTGSRVALLVGLATMGLGVQTWRQVQTWHDSQTLWQHAVAVDPQNWMALNNLAAMRFHEGRLNDAERLAARAAALRSDFADGIATLGAVYDAQGRCEEAIATYRRSLLLSPVHPVAGQLGSLLERLSRNDEAVSVYEQSLAGGARHEEVLVNLSALYVARHQPQRAVRLWQRIAAEQPDDPRPRVNLAAALAAAGRWNEAVEAGQEAVNLARQVSDEQLARQMLARLDLYRQRRMDPE